MFNESRLELSLREKSKSTPQLTLKCSVAPCFSLLNFILLSISANQLPLINVKMGFICKNLLSLYAILHTSTVKFSILWFAVVTGKNIEAHKIVFKSTKRTVVSISHQC